MFAVGFALFLFSFVRFLGFVGLLLLAEIDLLDLLADADGSVRAYHARKTSSIPTMPGEQRKAGRRTDTKNLLAS